MFNAEGVSATLSPDLYLVVACGEERIVDGKTNSSCRNTDVTKVY
jgi:hypothetical protein